MIAVVLGPDALLARETAARLAADRDPGGENTSRYDGREATVAQLAAAVGSAGFFGGQVFVVTDLLARATKGAAGEGDGGEAAPKGSIDLKPLLAGVAPANTLILVDATLASVPAAAKRLLPAEAQVLTNEPPRGAGLIAWLEQEAKHAGGRIERAAAQSLVESLFPQTWRAKPSNPRFDRPPDLVALRNEIAKLVLAADPAPVSVRHVHELSASVPEERLFAFLDAAMAGELGSAVAELDRLLVAGEEPAKLAAQLQQQAELAVIAAAAGGREATTVGRDLGLANPARMSGVASGVRRARRDPRRALRSALANDRALKAGRLRHPADALVDLVVSLAGAGVAVEGGGQ